MEFDPGLGSSVGVVVRDLEPVLELYTEGLGLGPFAIEEIDAPTAALYIANGANFVVDGGVTAATGQPYLRARYTATGSSVPISSRFRTCRISLKMSLS